MNYSELASFDFSKTTATGTSSTDLSDDDIMKLLNASSNVENIVTNVNNKSGNVYNGKGSGGGAIPQQVLKIGKASGPGSFSFTIGGEFSIGKVVINGYSWKTSSKISINGLDEQSSETAQSLKSFSFELDSPTKEINVSVTSSAVCVSSIILYKKSFQQYNVTFDNNYDGDGEDAVIQTNESTGLITKPSDPERDGFTFAGWYTDKECTIKYEFDTKVESDMTLFAKWDALNNTYQEAIDIVKSKTKLAFSYDVKTTDVPIYEYTKVTSAEDLTSGKYLIVYEDGNVAFDGSLETLDTNDNTISVTIENNKITDNQNLNNCTFTYDSSNSTLKSASGYYIGKTAFSNGFDSSDTKEYTNTITFDKEKNAIITSSGNAVLKYNNAIDQNRFRYYKSGQKDIQLYKQVETGNTKEVTTYENGKFVLGVAIDDAKSILEELIKTSVSSYGIQVSTEDRTEEYTNLEPGYEDGLLYTTIKLGDVLSHKERARLDFTVRAFMVVDGVKYYSTNVNEYKSINAMLDAYEVSTKLTEDQKAIVTELKTKLA